MKLNRKADPLYIVLVALIALLLISSVLLGGLYARYVSKDSIGDQARVAKFDIVETGSVFQEAFAISLDPALDDKGAAYAAVKNGAVVLTNQSEVSVRCTFSTESTENLPLLYSWSCAELDAEIDAVNRTVSFLLPANDTAKVFDLAVEWDVSTEKNREFVYNRQVDGIILSVYCEQID